MFDFAQLYSRTLTPVQCNILARMFLEVARTNVKQQDPFLPTAVSSRRIGLSKTAPQHIIMQFQRCAKCGKDIGNNRNFILPLVAIMDDVLTFTQVLRGLIEEHRNRPECKPPRPIKYKSYHQEYEPEYTYEELK